VTGNLELWIDKDGNMTMTGSATDVEMQRLIDSGDYEVTPIEEGFVEVRQLDKCRNCGEVVRLDENHACPHIGSEPE
jgi:hypothetical protein